MILPIFLKKIQTNQKEYPRVALLRGVQQMSEKITGKPKYGIVISIYLHCKFIEITLPNVNVLRKVIFCRSRPSLYVSFVTNSWSGPEKSSSTDYFPSNRPLTWHQKFQTNPTQWKKKFILTDDNDADKDGKWMVFLMLQQMIMMNILLVSLLTRIYIGIWLILIL